MHQESEKDVLLLGVVIGLLHKTPLHSCTTWLVTSQLDTGNYNHFSPTQSVLAERVISQITWLHVPSHGFMVTSSLVEKVNMQSMPTMQTWYL